MYRAKWDGRNGYAVFESAMKDTVQNRMELEMELREALDKEEFVLAYQPTLDLSSMRPTGVEALVRWEQPQARHGAAGRLHPGARGDGADRRRRQMGARRGVPAGRALARRGAPR